MKIFYLFICTYFLMGLGCNSEDKKTINVNHSVTKIVSMNQDSIIKYKLLKFYSVYIDSIANNYVYFKDKSKLKYENSKQKKTFDDSLNLASIKDQFSQKYLKGKEYFIPIPLNYDAGRIRNDEFFKKIYGGSKNEVENNLTIVNWLPKKLNMKIKFSKRNGASEQLQKVSNELDKLPDSLLKYMRNLGGSFSWRPIAGTNRQSMHSYGVALDINTKYSHYWRNSKPNTKGIYEYRNFIPFPIVAIFEKYGFIWGGKWYHYDTMHFEYRPELL